MATSYLLGLRPDTKPFILAERRKNPDGPFCDSVESAKAAGDADRAMLGIDKVSTKKSRVGSVIFVEEDEQANSETINVKKKDSLVH